MWANFSIGDSMIINIGYDVTKQKRSEEALVAAKEKAEESDRLKSAFLANMSHEIRTPMNGIIGFTDLLKKPDLTGEQKDSYINIIKKSGNRMLDTVNDIIDISKIDSGQVEISNSTFDINNEIDEQYQFFKQEAFDKGLEFKLQNKLSYLHKLITTDKVKINSIVSNLIKNAIKYTDRGEIEIICEKKASNFVFEIKDTGIGIPKNRINYIFNRFEQADIADLHAKEGSGLGLSIAKAYAEMLKGKIDVKSVVGKGSVFSFSIPWNYETTEISSARSKEKANKKSFGKKLNILIVEDDDISFEHLKIIISHTAKNISRAFNGKEAIEFMKNNSDIELILMDIKIPLINGYDATR